MCPLAFGGHGGSALLASVAQAAGRKEPELPWEQQGLWVPPGLGCGFLAEQRRF